MPVLVRQAQDYLLNEQGYYFDNQMQSRKDGCTVRENTQN
jgi:hypothetical protein